MGEYGDRLDWGRLEAPTAGLCTVQQESWVLVAVVVPSAKVVIEQAPHPQHMWAGDEIEAPILKLVRCCQVAVRVADQLHCYLSNTTAFSKYCFTLQTPSCWFVLWELPGMYWQLRSLHCTRSP